MTIPGLVLLALFQALGLPVHYAMSEEATEACVRDGEKRWVCEWAMDASPLREGAGAVAAEAVRFAIPPVGASFVDVRIEGGERFYQWRFEAADGERLGAIPHAPIAERTEGADGRWVLFVEFDASKRYEFVLYGTDAPFPESAPMPAEYTIEIRFEQTFGTAVASTRAGSPDDPQLSDAEEEVGYLDIHAAWFDDPVLDDDLLEAGIVSPDVGAVAAAGPSGSRIDFGLRFRLLGEDYTILWSFTRPFDAADPAKARAWSGILFRDGVTREAMLHFVPRVDPENGTLRALVPTAAIGRPAPGERFTNLSAFSAVVRDGDAPAYFLPPASRIDPQRLEHDAADTQVRDFALGGPEVWAALRGVQPSATTPFPPSATDPWLLAILALLGAVVVLGTAAMVTRRRPIRAEPPVEGAIFLGKYAVERRIGAGGFGHVWLATHVALGRKVVIKMLDPAWASVPEAVERFRREARILAGLDHPHVTRVYDAEIAAGAWYIVMEYVDGGSLADRKLPLGVPEATRATLAILDGLAYIHARGVLHRDLKPANVLTTTGGIAKIADFGVARSADGVRTTTGGAPGTPFYMAPEQVRGEPGTEIADLYAVAAMFHELATGRPYFDADPADLFALRRAIVEAPPRLPARELPAPVNAWLARGLAKEPAGRFASAGEMREALLTAERTS